MMREVTCVVNGDRRSAAVDSRTLLSDYLRHHLALTGTHVGCEQGVCGACTVIVDGRAVRSCLILAVQCEGADVETIEGLGGQDLHPLQQAFARHHALQCGFCTPGFLMSLAQYLRDHDDCDDLSSAVAGNLCRCTGYRGIVEAAREAAAVLGASKQSEGGTRCPVPPQ